MTSFELPNCYMHMSRFSPPGRACHLDRVLLADQHARRLDRTVNQATTMCVLERRADAVGDLEAVRKGDRRPALDESSEALSVNQFHRDKRPPFVRIHLEDGDDVRMVESCR